MSWREFSLIPELQGILGAPLDVGEDALVLPIPGKAVVSVDQYVEGVDFDFTFMAREDAGFRALAAAASDLAAMGAEPLAYLVAVGLPATARPEDALALARGLREAADSLGLRFAGGDLGRANAVVLGITVLGALAADPLTRRGAAAGDLLAVTGVPGLAALGLYALRHGLDLPAARQRFLRPVPRLQAGRRLCGIATSAIDVTDGLLREVAVLAELSGTGVEIDVRRLPVPPEANALARETWRRLQLSGGDDYELLFTVPEAKLALAEEAVRPVPVCVFGRMLPGPEGRWLVDEEGRRPLPAGGYEHGVVSDEDT